MSNTPLVSICSITYNHAPYIRQCLDGFLMQQTNFPIEIIINDDCSTDGTTEIIKEYAAKYPDLIHPIFHEENQYQKGVRGIFATFVFPKARGKYIALCEGDDYWTDPLKLQKQVDILEANPSVELVYTSFRTVDETSCLRLYKNMEYYKKISRSGDLFEALLHFNFIMTLTCCYRKEVIETDLYKKSPRMRDYTIFLSAASLGDMVYINEETGCYRRLQSGMVLSSGNKLMSDLYDVFLHSVRYFLHGKTKTFSFVKKVRILNIILFKLIKGWGRYPEKRNKIKEFAKYPNLWCVSPITLGYVAYRKIKNM